jgi:hypothetical protein
MMKDKFSLYQKHSVPHIAEEKMGKEKQKRKTSERRSMTVYFVSNMKIMQTQSNGYVKAQYLRKNLFAYDYNRSVKRNFRTTETRGHLPVE